MLSAYENEERQIWQESASESPHGQKWHLSFHASSFPGDDESVCGRAQVYNLLDPAPASPLEPKTRMLFDLGTEIEHMFVKRWSNYGVLLSADVTGDDKYQTGFEDPSCWLTGSPDAILLIPFSSNSEVVDVKTTSQEKVEKMKNDPEFFIYSHKKYIRQVKAYIAEANEKFSPTVIVCGASGTLINNGQDHCSVVHQGVCIPKILKVKPPNCGTLLYASREEPLTCMMSYYVQHDPEMIQSGKQKLSNWKQEFIDGKLPAHVNDGDSKKWTSGECAYCKHKQAKYCKEDYKNKVTNLEKSALIEFNKKYKLGYSYEQTRKEVLKRWQ